MNEVTPPLSHILFFSLLHLVRELKLDGLTQSQRQVCFDIVRRSYQYIFDKQREREINMADIGALDANYDRREQ